MSKLAGLLVLLCLSPGAQAQLVFSFQDEAKARLHEPDERTAIASRQAGSQPYDFMAVAPNELEELFLSRLKVMSKNRRDPLQRSRVLTILSQLCTAHYGGGRYEETSKWVGTQKQLRRAFRFSSQSSFGIIESFSFRVPLLKHKGAFYHDAKGAKGALNLYKGEKPRGMNTEEAPPPVPLDYFTAAEFIQLLERMAQKKGIRKALGKGIYSSVGISIELEKNTLFRRKIPTARVVVILGARRLHAVKR
jgi:hypothetical protein